MTDESLSFRECLDLIEDRSAALRDAVAEAPDLAARVPCCPDWSLRELVAHVGEVQRFWAATARIGDTGGPPSPDLIGDATPQGDLLSWSSESTDLLVGALREAGPDRECWTWWGVSQAPMTVGAVARQQVQEAAVHAYDAQDASGLPQRLPVAAAVDGIGAFLTVALGTAGTWAHRPGRIAWCPNEGPRRFVDLTGSGAAVNTGEGPEPAASVHGPASDLLLALHRRIPAARLLVEGDRDLVRELLAWPSLG